MAVLQNENLVDTFTKQGSPYMVDVYLQEVDGPGHLKWSSNNPPPFPITAGTEAGVTITLREQAPLTMIIPAFRKLFGLSE